MVSSNLANSQVRRAPATAGSLYDVLDLILDKGIVVDAYVRISVVGIELITIDARVVKIAGGSIEVMKTIIARDMFKDRSRSKARRD